MKATPPVAYIYGWSQLRCRLKWIDRKHASSANHLSCSHPTQEVQDHPSINTDMHNWIGYLTRPHSPLLLLLGSFFKDPQAQEL